MQSGQQTPAQSVWRRPQADQHQVANERNPRNVSEEGLDTAEAPPAAAGVCLKDAPAPTRVDAHQCDDALQSHLGRRDGNGLVPARRLGLSGRKPAIHARGSPAAPPQRSGSRSRQSRPRMFHEERDDPAHLEVRTSSGRHLQTCAQKRKQGRQQRAKPWAQYAARGPPSEDTSQTQGSKHRAGTPAMRRAGETRRRLGQGSHLNPHPPTAPGPNQSV